MFSQIENRFDIIKLKKKTNQKEIKYELLSSTHIHTQTKNKTENDDVKDKNAFWFYFTIKKKHTTEILNFISSEV